MEAEQGSDAPETPVDSSTVSGTPRQASWRAACGAKAAAGVLRETLGTVGRHPAPAASWPLTCRRDSRWNKRLQGEHAPILPRPGAKSLSVGAPCALAGGEK